MRYQRILNIGLGRLLLALMLFSVSLLALTGCSSRSSSGKFDPESGTRRFSDEELALQSGRFEDGTIPVAAEGGLFKDVYFDYDSSTLRQEYYEILQDNAKILKNDSSLRVEVEGHCDKRGTSEYNLVLGEERAKSVASLLISYGARPGQLSWISYGEEIPVDPGNTEEAFAKNRRVHFVLFRRPEKKR